VLDKVLPAYLLLDSDITNEPTGTKIFRGRTAQGTQLPFIIVGDSRDVDPGHVAGPGRLIGNELGNYSIIVASEESFNQVDKVTSLIIDKLRGLRGQFIPTSSSSPRMYIQGILIKDRRQFNYTPPKDGDDTPYMGYIIEVFCGSCRLVE